MKEWLQQRPARERALLIFLAIFTGAALLWWLAFAPALQTYRASSNMHAQIDETLTQMQAMAQEVKRIRSEPRLAAPAVQSWLDASVKKLGKARVSIQNGRAHVQFAGASPEALATWLSEARTNAQLMPIQVNWRRSAPIKGSSNILWDGSLIFELPSA